jgi:cysteine desulfurase
MARSAIYLDYNATAPMKPSVLNFLCDQLGRVGNASSVHNYGRAARKIIEDARQQCAALWDCEPTQIIFNGGATEGNNTILNFFAHDVILTSSIEHPSVIEASPNAHRLPVTADGVIDLIALEAALGAHKPTLVSIMAVNNETGVIQPLKEIATLVKNAGAFLHVDAVQAIGKIPFSFKETGADFVTISAHKFGGPQGVGALIIGPCGIAPRLLVGGGQEKSQRAGTENVAGIGAMGIAAQSAQDDLANFQELAQKRDNLADSMLESCPSLIINGANAPRTANTLNVSLPGVEAQTMLMAFDLDGIAIGSGSACSSGTMKPSYVLQAMGHDIHLSRSSLRISMGWATTDAEIAQFLTAWQRIVARLVKS